MAVFRAFGPDHWAVLGTVGVASAALVGSAQRIRRVSHDTRVRGGLALALLVNQFGFWGYALSQGYRRLPFQLCDLAVVAMAWALLGSNRLVAELAFCWGLAGSLQAVLTPDLLHEFPSYQWWTFFIGHAGVVLSAVYLAVRGQVHLTTASVWRVWLLSNVYALAAGLLNWRLGTNFGYLARKPLHPSLLDWLGPWPIYIMGIEVVALALFFLCLGISRGIDRLSTKHGDGKKVSGTFF